MAKDTEYNMTDLLREAVKHHKKDLAKALAKEVRDQVRKAAQKGKDQMYDPLKEKAKEGLREAKNFLRTKTGKKVAGLVLAAGIGGATYVASHKGQDKPELTHNQQWQKKVNKNLTVKHEIKSRADFDKLLKQALPALMNKFLCSEIYVDGLYADNGKSDRKNVNTMYSGIYTAQKDGDPTRPDGWKKISQLTKEDKDYIKKVTEYKKAAESWMQLNEKWVWGWYMNRDNGSGADDLYDAVKDGSYTESEFVALLSVYYNNPPAGKRAARAHVRGDKQACVEEMMDLSWCNAGFIEGIKSRRMLEVSLYVNAANLAKLPNMEVTESIDRDGHTRCKIVGMGYMGKYFDKALERAKKGDYSVFSLAMDAFVAKNKSNTGENQTYIQMLAKNYPQAAADLAKINADTTTYRALGYEIVNAAKDMYGDDVEKMAEVLENIEHSGFLSDDARGKAKLNLAEVNFKNGNNEECIKLCREVEKMALENESDARFLEAHSYAKVGDYDKSEKAYRKAVESKKEGR
ncbi:MAG: hypothetical protein IJ184_05320 [Alphaproteobacteria bacterium]|nr:hypothetical protein [Alphaproteobacteria bacterium]